MRLLYLLLILLSLFGCTEPDYDFIDELYFYELDAIDIYDQMSHRVELDKVFNRDWDWAVLLSPYETRNEIRNISIQAIREYYGMEFRDDIEIILFAQNNKFEAIWINQARKNIYVDLAETQSSILSRDNCFFKSQDILLTGVLRIDLCPQSQAFTE